jgi:hypothetical protein
MGRAKLSFQSARPSGASAYLQTVNKLDTILTDHVEALARNAGPKWRTFAH